MHVHLVGVSGTGMGALAALFRERGDRVTGSDVAFHPPVGPFLREAGVECLEGWNPAHLEPAPDLVIVGNAIRRDNPEAMAAEARGLRRESMSGALRAQFLAGRRAVVIGGTHGKTTTSAISAHVLRSAGLEPGWFIGGLPKNLPAGAGLGRAKRSLLDKSPSPFVVEGDEYDAVYWNKQPKLLDYVGVSSTDVAVITSVEHDHVDIYPDEASYVAAFRAFVERIPEGGLLVVDASQKLARDVAKHAKCTIAYYALDRDDTGDVTPTWLAALGPIEGGMQQFDAFVGGASIGRFALRVPGAHNVRNALAALAVAAQGFEVPWSASRAALASFEGVARRQDLLGTPRGVLVYDDFAHHPTAVDETLRALRRKHPAGRLFAVFEPRSATACRNVHQEAYGRSFGAADRVLLAPLGRANVPEAERLDRAAIARVLGPKAETPDGVDAIVATLAREAKAGDVIAIMSNGAFGGLHEKLLSALAKDPP
jgi:UDP-N-acetylmuramate: L-alanyl-gamma-D-glutamyl-meso-diaminopimelate ligase